MLNQILAGHYRVTRTLGEGGWAKTHIVEDLHRPGHPQCVVKYLKPMSVKCLETMSDDTNFLTTARRLFQKEAEILEKLGRHLQIPRLLAYFEHDREFYLVQEFIDGLTLNTELPPGHRWSESKVILFLKDVLSILEFVHSYGVIHRDIKPSNLIRRDSDGRLVLIDFGAVKQILGLTATEEASLRQMTIGIGTRGYMPTEQARGKPRLNSDLYALGIIGIQALTGVNPLQLEEDGDGEIIWQDQAKVSAELATILSQMVRYHFRDRYQSATEVLQDLQSFFPETKVILESSLSPGIRIIPEISHPKTASTLLEATEATQCFLLPESPLEIGIDNSLNETGKPLKKKFWLIGGGIVAVLASISLIGSYGYPYWSASRALERTRSLETTTQYEECVQQAKAVSPKYSQLYTEAQELTGKCLLAQAEKLASNNQWEEAIKLVGQIPVNVSSYSQAQKLLEQGAEKIWQATLKKYQQGNLNEAIASAEMIPKTSLLSSQVGKAIQKWQQEWKDNETNLKTSQQALNSKQWSKAIEETKKISDHPYWQKQAKSIIDQANSEIAKSEQGKVIKKNIKPRTSTARYSRPKTSIARYSRPKTSTVRTSRKAPSRASRSSNGGIPRDTSPACSGGQC